MSMRLIDQTHTELQSVGVDRSESVGTRKGKGVSGAHTQVNTASALGERGNHTPSSLPNLYPASLQSCLWASLRGASAGVSGRNRLTGIHAVRTSSLGFLPFLDIAIFALRTTRRALRLGRFKPRQTNTCVPRAAATQARVYSNANNTSHQTNINLHIPWGREAQTLL